MRSSTGFRSWRASSGSRSASKAMEPLRSANSTVICLRSPSSAFREVRIFSARWRGGALLSVGGRAGSGVAVATRVAAWRGVAQAPQNLNWDGLSKPQAGQWAGSGAAQAPQNFMPSGFSKSQLGQSMGPPLSYWCNGWEQVSAQPKAWLLRTLCPALCQGNTTRATTRTLPSAQDGLQQGSGRHIYTDSNSQRPVQRREFVRRQGANVRRQRRLGNTDEFIAVYAARMLQALVHPHRNLRRKAIEGRIHRRTNGRGKT